MAQEENLLGGLSEQLSEGEQACPYHDIADDRRLPMNQTNDAGDSTEARNMEYHFSSSPLTELNLASLPLEVLMHMCSFLDAKCIIETLSQVSQPFNDILTVDSYWKARISKRWPRVYPAVPVDNFDWKKACIEREELYRYWSNPQEHFEQFSFTSGTFAPVDAVHLLKDRRMFVSGSRDRYLNIVDVDKLGNTAKAVKEANIHSIIAHKGWVWSLASVNSTICSGSWDTYIKLWDLEAGCTEVSKFKCKSAVLNLHMEPGLIIAGCYDKRVYMVDPRTGDRREKRFHRQPVLCLAVDEHYVITGSEDKTLNIYDRRAEKTFKTIPMECFPMSLSFGENQLWVGDKKGLLHLYDTRHGNFDLVQVCDVGHTGKVTGVQHSLGALFTCSTDKTIRVLQPTQDPPTITTLHQDGELAGLHYRNGLLVSAGSGVSVGVWRPKRTTSDEAEESHDHGATDQSDHPEESNISNDTEQATVS